MWSFWRPRERFSLEELKYLNEQLQGVTVVNESNKDFVIETLRSMAELLIWGDQHDPAFFEFFMEKQVITHFSYILMNSRTASVAIQLLQTLNIMIQNLRSDQAIYYLFSNEHINNLITYPFNFQNEELLAYYISFLRTISTKLNKNTISFFVKTQNDSVISFPLYSEAIKFAHHEESMVRIAVRTLTLNIYHVNDESIRDFVVSPEVVGYFSDLVMFLRQQTFTLVDLVTEVARNPDSCQTVGRLEEAIAETGDLLYYCNDIISAGVPNLSRLMSQHMLSLLVVPVLIPSLRSFQGNGMQFTELCSLYLLSCLLQIVKHKDLVNGIGLELLKKNSSKDERIAPEGELAASQQRENEKVTCQSSRELLLSYLFCENERLVLASLSVLVALLQNKALNETLLDALGVLPPRKRYKKLLLQALVGSKSDEEVLFSSSPNGHEDDFGDLSSMNTSNFNVLMGEENGTDIRENNEEASSNYDEVDYQGLVDAETNNGEENDSCEPRLNNGSSQLSLRRNRYQVVDALMKLLCRRPPPCAEALWHTGWLLRQLLPYHEQKLHDHHLQMLNRAHVAAQEDLLKEVKDCWCDMIPTVLHEEWKICKKALETPALQKDFSFVLLPNFISNFPEGDLSSSFVGERLRTDVKVFIVLHQLRTLVLEGSIPDNPHLGQPKEPIAAARTGRAGVEPAAVRRDIELDLTPGDAIPCRIAFQKGKERAVYLLVHSKGTSGWLILAEDIPMRPTRGIIRVIAALAGSNPRVDEEHPKWLHLRIRSPHYPSIDAGRIGTTAGRSHAKKLVDGRWTLAFPDEKSCKHAKVAVLEEMAILSSSVEQVLEPLLLSPTVSRSNENAIEA